VVIQEKTNTDDEDSYTYQTVCLLYCLRGVRILEERETGEERVMTTLKGKESTERATLRGFRRKLGLGARLFYS